MRFVNELRKQIIETPAGVTVEGIVQARGIDTGLTSGPRRFERLCHYPPMLRPEGIDPREVLAPVLRCPACVQRHPPAHPPSRVRQRQPRRTPHRTRRSNNRFTQSTCGFGRSFVRISPVLVLRGSARFGLAEVFRPVVLPTPPHVEGGEDGVNVYLVAGFQVHLPKPALPQELFAMISRLLDGGTPSAA